jgi:hypothetical protein
MTIEEEKIDSSEGKTLELIIAIGITIFAAMLAINDLGAGRFGDDEKIAYGNKTEMYNWYQAKSIKEMLYEDQIKLISILEKTSSIKEEHKKVVDSFKLAQLAEINRYKKEKKEIMEGSSGVGEKNWVLKDDEGKLGNITGAKQWKVTTDKLGSAGDMYDLASLFLQISIVFGAISLVIQKDGTRKKFFYLMIGVGILGTYFTIHAYSIAMI